MTAVVGGSKTFVAGILPRLEVQDMYAMVLRTELQTRTNASLTEYARHEYGTADAAWLVATARRESRRPRRRASMARRIRKAFSARTTATGVPRLAEDCPARA